MTNGLGKEGLSRRSFLKIAGLAVASVVLPACTEKVAAGAPNGGETAIRKATSTQRTAATATATQGAEGTKNPATATNPATTPGKETPKTPIATVTPISTETLQNCPADVLRTAASMTADQIKENAATPYFFAKPGEGATEEQAKKELAAHLAVAEDVLAKYLNTTTVQSTAKTVLVSPYLKDQMASDYQDLLTVKNIVLKAFPEGAKPTMQLDGLSIVTSIWPKDGVMADLVDKPKASPRTNAEGAAYWLNGTYKWMPTDQTKNPGYHTVPNSWDSHWVAVFDEKDKTKSCGKALVKIDDKGKVLVFDPNKFVTGQEKAEQVWMSADQFAVVPTETATVPATEAPDPLKGVDAKNPSTFPAEVKAYWTTGEWPKEDVQNRLSTEFFQPLYIKILKEHKIPTENLTPSQLYWQASKIANKENYALPADLTLTRDMFAGPQAASFRDEQGKLQDGIFVKSKIDYKDKFQLLPKARTSENLVSNVFGKDILLQRKRGYDAIYTSEATAIQFKEDVYMVLFHYKNTYPGEEQKEYFLPLRVIFEPSQVTQRMIAINPYYIESFSPPVTVEVADDSIGRNTEPYTLQTLIGKLNQAKTVTAYPGSSEVPIPIIDGFEMANVIVIEQAPVTPTPSLTPTPTQVTR